MKKTPVVVVSGWTGAMAAVASSLIGDGTAVVHHDLSHVLEGVVRRTVTAFDGSATTTVLELAHGCVFCTLREDLLPLLRKLSARSSVRRIVLHLDRTLETEAVCWAIDNVVVADVIGQIDGPASRDVRIEAVITCLDAETWLSDASGDDTLSERGILTSDHDERTVAQLVVGQVDYADVIVVSGGCADAWERSRLAAVLLRLAPGAPIAWVSHDSEAIGAELLRAVPTHARRGESTDAHSPLLRGEPPLTSDCGVTLVEFTAARPFHPERLHEAIDVLLEGVVTARGRAWVATQPDEALWLESAGGGLRIASAGKWLAAMAPAEQEHIPTARRAMAALRWDDVYGDRDTSIVVLVHGADPSEITRSLSWALVSDDELTRPQEWKTWGDPFGEWHEDPCEPSSADLVKEMREAQE